MPGDLYDVFVVGAADASAGAAEALAAALAGGDGAKVAALARAIAERTLRAGQALPQAQAEALVMRLRGFGAITELRAAGAPPGHPGVSPLAPPQPGATGGLRPPPSFGAIGNLPPPPFPGGIGGLPRAPAPGAIGTLPPPPALPNSRAGAPEADPPAPSAFAPPDPEGGEGALELDLTPAAHKRRPSAIWGGNDGALSGPPTASALAAAGDEHDADVEGPSTRCPKHGLLYDGRRAAGCRRCLGSARKVAARTDARGGLTRLSLFDSDPAKRAFVGLVAALLLGCLPALYHALHVSPARVAELRAEQEALSQKPGTEQILARFDTLEELVEQTRSTSMRNTGLLWAATTLAAMAGFYRLTS